jgi:hypothetical protein
MVLTARSTTRKSATDSNREGMAIDGLPVFGSSAGHLSPRVFFRLRRTEVPVAVNPAWSYHRATRLFARTADAASARTAPNEPRSSATGTSYGVSAFGGVVPAPREIIDGFRLALPIGVPISSTRTSRRRVRRRSRHACSRRRRGGGVLLGRQRA